MKLPSLAKDEPVIVGAAVTWLLAQVGAYLIGYTHLVTRAQWGSVTTVLEPVISAAVLAVLAAVVRSRVKPTTKPASPAVTRDELAAAFDQLALRLGAHPCAPPVPQPPHPHPMPGPGA